MHGFTRSAARTTSAASWHPPQQVFAAMERSAFSRGSISATRMAAKAAASSVSMTVLLVSGSHHACAARPIASTMFTASSLSV
jgi:hypothetical protein